MDNESAAELGESQESEIVAAEEQSLESGSPSIGDIQGQLNALIDGHTKLIDNPPDGTDRDALIKERSLAHNALIAMGAPRA